MCIALKGGIGWVGRNKLTSYAAKKVMVGFKWENLFGVICIQEEVGYIII